ncbi:MAG: NUDIX domain-containing protein [Clostridia bacterium]|nr:NUDIX domain-containing protein [Clostridia bacterium]
MKSAGFARAVLDTREELTAARRLYENHGFTGIPRYNENAQAELFYGRDLASWEIRPLSVVCPSRQSPQPDFVVVAARFEDRWIWVRHRERDTWEMPGGHVEPGEPPDAAAHRELYEETGAEAFGLTRIGPYGVARDDAMSSGVLYLAEITRLGTLPDFEIAERRLLAEPPGRLTYPAIQPYLNAWAMEWTGSRVSANPAQGPGDGGR